MSDSTPSDPALEIAGIRLAAIAAEIRYADRLDLVLIELAENSSVAGVFTQNAFCAAPVTVCREHLSNATPRYLLINTGNANAGTGDLGIKDARDCCQAVADAMNVDVAQVLPFSTGVIGESLPTEKILAKLEDLGAALAPHQFPQAARGILTTDTRPKLVSSQHVIDSKSVTLTGIAKGSGMIKPNMATMLSYVFTDAAIAQDDLKALLGSAVAKSFNRITVDGDTSTNDCCLLVATGRGELDYADLDVVQKAEFQKHLESAFVALAQGLIRDAEGASKFITIDVEGGRTAQECLQVCYAVAESPLVKTALFASDPNWGRILAVVGRAGLPNLDVDGVRIYLGEVLIVSNGMRDEAYTEAMGQAEMDKKDIHLRIVLGRGEVSERVWTSDLSHEYVSINADYRS